MTTLLQGHRYTHYFGGSPANPEKTSMREKVLLVYIPENPRPERIKAVIVCSLSH
jgi:hypothetical protein